jgi:DNA polymerase I
MNLADKLKQFMATQEVESQPSSIREKVLIVDGLNSYLRCFAATPTMNDNGDHVGGIVGFLKSIGATIRNKKPTRVIVFFDGKGGSQKRRELFKGYKDNRRTMTKLNRTYGFDSIDSEQTSQKWQLLVLVEALKCLPVTVIIPENVEADDGIAYAAQEIVDRGGSVIIMSNDKDFLQLVNESISVWNPVTERMFTPPQVVEKYGIHPNNFLLYRAVTGDKSDNIPGVEGIKEKTLAKYFPELKESVPRDITYLITEAERITSATKKPPVTMQTLLASREQLELNYKLMRLDDVAMSGAARIKILDAIDAARPRLNKIELIRILNSIKSMTAFGRFDDWISGTFLQLHWFATKENHNV